MAETQRFDYSNPYVPADMLRALHGVESSFSKEMGPSPKGALGPFQFQEATGKEYGLQTPEDRLSFEKAKLAAGKYLAKLYNEFGNWEEAFRAYNAGPTGYRQIKSGVKKSPENEAYYGKIRKLLQSDGQTPISSRGILMAGLKLGKPSDTAVADAEKPASETPSKPTRSLQDIVSLTNQLYDVTKPEREKIAAERQRIATMTGDIASRELALEQQKARGVVEMREQEKAARDAATAEFEQAKKDQPTPAFVPTRDNAEDLAKLFSFIGVMGTLLGKGGGKQAAMGAMAAMNGMMQGWQKGRMDLYNQEKVKFEKDLAQVNKIHDELYKKMKNAIDLASKDKDLAQAKLEEAIALSGSDILKMKLQLQGPQETLKTLEETVKGKNELMRTAAGFLEKDRAAEARERSLELRQQQAEATLGLRQQQIDLQREGLALRERALEEKGKGGGKEKTTADIRNKVDNLRDGLRDMSDVLEKLDSPVIKKEWEKGSVELRRFLAEKPKSGSEDSIFNQFIKQKAVQSLSPEVRGLIVTIASARNDYYKLKSGTAVSGNEATRSFGATIQPSDSLDQLRTKAGAIAKKVSGNLSDYMDDYAFAQSMTDRVRSDIDRAKKYYEPQLPKGIPKGSRLIGKSPAGQDVYEAPDGTRHTPD